MYDINRLSVVCDLGGVTVLLVIYDTSRAEDSLQDLRIVKSQRNVVYLLGGNGKGNVYVQTLAGFHSTDTHRQIDVAFRLRIEPVIDIFGYFHGGVTQRLREVIFEEFLKSDNEVMSMISEASKAEIEAKKAEEAAKKNELKLIKELKTELKNDYKTIKSIVDGINTSIATPNFKLTRWHINEMILMCNEMKTKINVLIGEETQNVSDTQEDTI